MEMVSTSCKHVTLKKLHNYELSESEVYTILDNTSDDEIIDGATNTRYSPTFRTLSSVQKIESTAQ